MRHRLIHTLRVFSCLILCAVSLMGCAARLVPEGATCIATGVMPGSIVTIPTGTNERHFVQRAPITQSVTHMKIEPTTQPTQMEIFTEILWQERAVDVYVTSQ